MSFMPGRSARLNKSATGAATATRLARSFAPPLTDQLLTADQLVSILGNLAGTSQ